MEFLRAYATRMHNAKHMHSAKYMHSGMHVSSKVLIFVINGE